MVHLRTPEPPGLYVCSCQQSMFTSHDWDIHPNIRLFARPFYAGPFYACSPVFPPSYLLTRKCGCISIYICHVHTQSIPIISIIMYIWLVVWNIWIIFPFHIWDVIRNPLTKFFIFQDGHIAPPTSVDRIGLGVLGADTSICHIQNDRNIPRYMGIPTFAGIYIYTYVIIIYIIYIFFVHTKLHRP